jgi:hypothetical protein
MLSVIMLNVVMLSVVAPYFAGVDNTMVEHSPHYLKVEGLSLATAVAPKE